MSSLITEPELPYVLPACNRSTAAVGRFTFSRITYNRGVVLKPNVLYAELVSKGLD